MTDAEARQWAFTEAHASFFERRDGEPPEQRLARLIRAAAPLAHFLVSGQVPTTDKTATSNRFPRNAEFADLVNRKGGQAEVARGIGTSKSYIGAVIGGHSRLSAALSDRVRALPDKPIVDRRRIVTPEQKAQLEAARAVSSAVRRAARNGAAAQ